MAKTNEEWMTMSDVASEAKIPLSTLYFLIRRNRGPKAAQIGRHLRVLRKDFTEWFENNRK